MKKLKEKLSGVTLFLFELAVGVLLLINANLFTTYIIMGFGAVMVVVGLVNVLRYFRTEAAAAAKEQALVKGLAAIAGGAYCLLKVDALMELVTVMTLLYGVVILFTGLTKVQRMMDMVRMKKGKWYLMALSAAVSIACGAIIVVNPFESMELMWKFTGVVLVAEAAFDLIVLIFGSKKKAVKEIEEEQEAEEEKLDRKAKKAEKKAAIAKEEEEEVKIEAETEAEAAEEEETAAPAQTEEKPAEE